MFDRVRWGRVAIAGFVIASGTAVIAGCTLLTPLGTDLTSDATDDAQPDARRDAADDVADAAKLDEGLADGASEGGPCVKGARVSAVRTFDPSPTPGFTCNTQNVFEEDGRVVGIDRGDTENPLDGSNVTGCLGVELASEVDQVTMRVQPTAQGCLTACSTTSCGTGNDFAFYAGVSEGALKKVTGVALVSTSLTDYVVAIPASGIRFAAVCRTGYGDSRDDVAVDVIHGRCR
jgi:hypothetical protein